MNLVSASNAGATGSHVMPGVIHVRSVVRQEVAPHIAIRSKTVVCACHYSPIAGRIGGQRSPASVDEMVVDVDDVAQPDPSGAVFA